MFENGKILYIGHWYYNETKITGVILQHSPEWPENENIYIWFSDGNSPANFIIDGGMANSVDSARHLAEKFKGHKIEWQKMMF